MKMTLNVNIMHNDNFFKRGLMEGLKDKFSLHGLSVCECMHPDFSDICFCFVRSEQQSRFCIKSRKNPFQLNFTIRNGNCKGLRVTECCIRESGVVYTNQPINLTVDGIYNEWRERIHYDNINGHCHLCDACAITKRERYVLSFLAQEMTQSQIASRLNLSVKTVNTYKTSAMNKLGFKRNVDLYHWLLGDWNYNI